MNTIRTKTWLINLFFLFLIGLCLRLYNFPQRVNFGPEQGVTLSTTYEYIHGKFSLLGLPNLQRFTTDGLQIFSGSLYNYALIPAMFALGKNPITFTYFALTINMLTALLMYYLILKLNGHKIAFFSTFFSTSTFTCDVAGMPGKRNNPEINIRNTNFFITIYFWVIY